MLALEQKKGRTESVDALANHFACVMWEERIKLAARYRISVAWARIAKDKVEGRNTEGNNKGNKLLNLTIYIIVNMVVIGGGLPYEPLVLKTLSFK